MTRSVPYLLFANEQQAQGANAAVIGKATATLTAAQEKDTAANNGAAKQGIAAQQASHQVQGRHMLQQAVAPAPMTEQQQQALQELVQAQEQLQQDVRALLSLLVTI